jgi:pSer/pThr/pTyr-binding forkhead associated (FHA) protein
LIRQTGSLRGTAFRLGQLTEVIADDQGTKKGRSWKIEFSKTSIGRGPSADVRLDDLSVSREHAVILMKKDGFYIQDLGSSNGTAVNGAKTTDCVKLNKNDVIAVGDVRLDFTTL